MAGTDRREQARLAIQSLAGDVGLPTDLTILSERWNTVARLGDSGVIAKAATLAHLSRIDLVHWFEQEARVCSELASVGAPVHLPWKPNDSCHVIDGMPITLWHWIDGEMAGSTEEEMVDSLAEIHRLGDEITLEQPWFATITVEIPGTLKMLAERRSVKQSDMLALSDHLNRLLDSVDAANLPEGFIHGDAQRKNSMHTDRGTVWIDLEETCRGPYAWDLACLTMNPIFDSDRVLDRYAEVSGTPRVDINHLDTLKQLRDLEGLVWMLAIRDEREPAFRNAANEQLARVRDTASVG